MDILLVVANASDSDFLDFMREAGHQVTVTESVAAAIAQYNARRFDAIIIDEKLPNASSFKLVERLKLDNRIRGVTKPVVMLVEGQSGSSLAVRHGADSVIFKTTEQLLAGSGLSAQLRLREVDLAEHKPS